MEELAKKSCFDEISHKILDSNAKVSVTSISSEWNISLSDSEALLQEWYERNNNSNVQKEFIVRAVISKDEHCLICLVKEPQLAKLKTQCHKLNSSLFSLELALADARRLGTDELSSSSLVNLQIDDSFKEINRIQKSKTPENKNIVNIQLENTTTQTTEFTSKNTEKEIPLKIEKIEPLKSNNEPSKSVSPITKSALNPNKTSGKSSITSFFLKPKTNSTTSTEHIEHPKAETLNISEDDGSQVIPFSEKNTKSKSSPVPKMLNKSTEEQTKLTSRKRGISNLVDSDNEMGIAPTPQQRKKRSKNTGPGNISANSKPSCDDNEDIPATPNKELESKSAHRTNKKLRIDSSEDEENDILQQEPKKKTIRKAKRTVTRTFEDKDGYIKTIKEIEEYTCSESDEQVLNSNKTEYNLKSPNICPPSSKKVSAPGKQGSIMNFFKKK